MAIQRPRYNGVRRSSGKTRTQDEEAPEMTLLGIEYLAPLAIGAVALIPQREYSDRKKIESTFRNIGFCVKSAGSSPQYPKLLKRDKCDNYTRYDFRLPYGLVPTDKLTDILTSSLRKLVEVKGEQIVSIYVYSAKTLRKWNYADLPANAPEGWITPIGHSHKGVIWHDFDATPHMTVAGTTRFGKTVFLKTTFTYLIETHPEDVEFYVIDLKGGLEFDRYRSLTQVKSVASNANEAAEMLTDIMEEIERTLDEFKARGINNVVNSSERKRRFIIVDEGAQLAPEKSMSAAKKKQLGYCQSALSEITRVAGALGYRLIFCTQYPTADTLPRQIKQNSDAKISFRLPTGYASQVAIDEEGAEQLERKGQAIYKTHERITVQTPLIEDTEIWRRLSEYETEGDVENAEDVAEGKAETTRGGNTVTIG